MASDWLIANFGEVKFNNIIRSTISQTLLSHNLHLQIKLQLFYDVCHSTQQVLPCVTCLS